MSSHRYRNEPSESLSLMSHSVRKLDLSGAVLLGCIAYCSSATGAELKFEHGRIVLETADKSLRVSAGARVQLDGVTFQGDNKFVDLVRFRRLRLNLAVDFVDDWHVKVEYEFVKRDEGWRNLWLSYTGIPNTRVTLGNQKSPVGLENSTSSADTTLLERSASNEFIPQYVLGGAVSTHPNGWTATAGVFREAITSRQNDPNRGVIYMGRLTWSPKIFDDQTFHLGFSATHFELESGGTLRIAAHPLVGITPEHLVNTHSIANVSATNLFGVEAAWSDGPVRLQSEYFWDILQRPGMPDPTFTGGYVQASWILTGEPYRYSHDTGTFEGIRPLAHYGAIEIAARIGTLDLQDSGVTGGQQNDVTLGINWYPNELLRFGANYVLAYAVPDSSGKHELLRAALLRAQINL